MRLASIPVASHGDSLLRKQPKLGGTTDAKAFVPFGMNAFIFYKEVEMNLQIEFAISLQPP
ncbi:MAG: hypothetical protein AUK02_06760 [Anaerolineae bacterium CG2_30_58_95]|nr:MAG: hypothetical protein AUK02_06760 [Anaerolineae bacterium CG2_30_58_95]